MHELTNEQRRRLNRLSVHLNDLLQRLEQQENRAHYINEAVDVLREADAVTASILWGTK